MRWGALAAALLAGACGRIGYDLTAGGVSGSGDAGPTSGDGSMPAIDAGPLAQGGLIAFVSSQPVVPSALGSAAAADAHCNTLATAAGLPGSYVAWLSGSGRDAIDLVAGVQGWVRVDGKPVARDAAQLVSGRLLYPIAVDEQGQPAAAGALVVTGTVADGTGGTTCQDWNPAGAASGTEGRAWSTGSEFTEAGVTGCDTPLPLYCLGIGDGAALTLAPRAGRVAFVTDQLWDPSTGRASADALCQSEAADANLPGSYLSFMALSSEVAAARLPVEGPTWVTTDGMPLADTAAQVLAGSVDTTISLTAGQTVSTAVCAWTGGFDPQTLPLANCNDWSTSSGSALAGRVSLTTDFFRLCTSDCTTFHGVYCLQL